MRKHKRIEKENEAAAKLVGLDQQRWAEGVKERLCAAWTNTGFNQAGFARAIGQSSSSVSLRMGSGSLDKWWQLVRISLVLDISIDELLGVEPHKPLIEPAGVTGVGEVLTSLRAAVERAEQLQRQLERAQGRRSGASRKQ